MKKILCLLLLCVSCTTKPKTTAIRVNMINNSHSVIFTGIDYAVLSELNRDTIPGIWQTLIPVYRMPADTDIKNYQPAQPGKYKLQDSAVVFTPDTPFVKGKTYFLRYYQFGQGQSAWDLIKGKNKIGTAHYIDLILRVGVRSEW